jgi:T-complex protein 1 subunit eta
MIVKSATKNTKIVGGGGAIEMELSRFLKEYSRTVPGKTQRVIAAFARALECIPRTLVQNSGGDATEILSTLRKKHNATSTVSTADGSPQVESGRWYGVDCIENGIKDTLKEFIWEPMTVRKFEITFKLSYLLTYSPTSPYT